MEDNFEKLDKKINMSADCIKKTGTKLIVEMKLLKNEEKLSVEEFTYTWEIRLKDGYSHFIDYGEDLVEKFIKRLEDGGEFIPFNKDLIVRVDEIISIEKVSEEI